MKRHLFTHILARYGGRLKGAKPNGLSPIFGLSGYKLLLEIRCLQLKEYHEKLLPA